MFRELINKVIPFIPIFGRRDILLVPKSMQRILGRQLLGHKTQLNKRAHSVLQEPIVGLIHVGEVVYRPTFAVFVVNAHVVEKDCVEANVFHLRDLFYFPQVLAVAFAEAKVGSS